MGGRRGTADPSQRLDPGFPRRQQLSPGLAGGFPAERAEKPDRRAHEPRHGRDEADTGGNMILTFLNALHAEGPAADRADKMALYGQFIGAWDLDVTEFKDDGTTRRCPGEWHFGWALEGRVVPSSLN